MMDSSPTDDFITQQQTNEKDHNESDENKKNDVAVILQVKTIEAIEDEFEDNSKVPHLSYWEIFVLFLNFGIHAWGGPVAEIAFIKERLVTKGQWISHARFNRVYSVYQILPGPEATELCMFFGFLAGRGRIGGFLGGLGFITPGFILMTLFSFIYIKIGLSNIYFNASFRALQPIVAAMVLRAVHKIGEHSFISSKTKKFNRWLFCLALLSAILSALNLNFFITLAGCGIAFMFIDRKMYWLGLLVLVLKFVGFGIYIGFKGVPPPTSIGIGVAKETDPGHIFGLGLLVGSLSFGGAYTTIPFMQAEVVTIGKWMTKQTFLDAIAIGQIIPAPLTMFSAFIGFHAGHSYGGYAWAFLEGFLITIAVFMPCFIFTILGHHLLEKLVRNKFLAAFFDGVTGSVVGIIATTALDLLKFSITNVSILKDLPPEKQNFVASQHSSLAAILYVLSLAILYSYRKSMIPFLLVIFGAIAGQFLFVIE